MQQHRCGAAEHRHVHAHQHAGDVIERCNGKQHVVASHAIAIGSSTRLEERVAVGEHCALRQTGGARGVGHERHVVQADAHGLRCGAASHHGKKVFAAFRHAANGSAFGKQLGRQIEHGIGRQQVGVVHHEHMFDRTLGLNLAHHRQQRRGRDDHACLQVVDLVGQLVLLVERAAGADDGADLLDAEVRHQVLRAVVEKEHHRLSLLHADGLQPGREGIARKVELRPGHGMAVPDARRAVAALTRMGAQVFVQRLLWTGWKLAQPASRCGCLHGVTFSGLSIAACAGPALANECMVHQQSYPWV